MRITSLAANESLVAFDTLPIGARFTDPLNGMQWWKVDTHGARYDGQWGISVFRGSETVIVETAA